MYPIHMALRVYSAFVTREVLSDYFLRWLLSAVYGRNEASKKAR